MTSISPELCIGGRDLTEPRLSPDATMLVYVESAGGSSSLMLSNLDDEQPQAIATTVAPRSGRGLGGGCWAWTPDSQALIYSGADGDLWSQPISGGAGRRLTTHGPDRTAQAPMVAADGNAVVYVVDQAEVWITNLSGGAPRRIDHGAHDFCFDPSISPDSATVCWQAWSAPHMPWQNAVCVVATLADGRIETVSAHGALQQPRHLPHSQLICVRDDTGWNNLWLGDRVLVDEPFEHAGPTWGLGQRSFAVSPDATEVAFTRNEHGFGRLCVVHRETGVVRQVARAVHGQLSWQGNVLAAVRTGACTPTQIVVYNTETWTRRTIAVGPAADWHNVSLVEPELHQVVASDGATIHARLYRAEKPTDRLLCWLHGGPTDQWQVTFMPRISYWRSLGWNVLVPDHRGSTGHGRAYQEAINGRWGDIDVNDICDVITAAQHQGWGAPQHTVLLGGSAGGFTVLGVLAAEPSLMKAAVVSYPVTDLFDLAERSHRFELHYTHSLVGPTPSDHHAPGPFHDRSPINFAEQIHTPLLMFHGDADAVVPVQQSLALAERIVLAGGTVQLQIYAGEGHGFRQRSNQLDEYERMGDFITEYVR